jgi:DedD protein
VERRVKERLIGAAVLLAAAIILIPEMLSGPKEATPPATQPAQASADTPLKSYSIDLNRSQASRPPASAPTTTTETTPAPPPETMPAPAPKPAPVEKPVEKPVENAPASTPAPVVAKHEPPPEASPAPVASTPAPQVKPKSGPLWAVQVGSFASRATAEKVAQSLKTDGYTAFVMPVTSGTATLYRVRVGPVSQRGDADALQRKLKPSVPQATVVAHP